jgi:hypothetical protein
VPGKTIEARRMFIRRALKINGIWPEAKAAARAAGVHNKETTLLAIASERSPEAQIEKVKGITADKAAPRRKSRAQGVSSSEAQSSTTGATNPHTSEEQSEPPSEPELDQSKPACTKALVEFANFMLEHISQDENIVLTLAAVEDVREFNRLANRVRLVLRKGHC